MRWYRVALRVRLTGVCRFGLERCICALRVGRFVTCRFVLLAFNIRVCLYASFAPGALGTARDTRSRRSSDRIYTVCTIAHVTYANYSQSTHIHYVDTSR